MKITILNAFLLAVTAFAGLGFAAPATSTPKASAGCCGTACCDACPACCNDCCDGKCCGDACCAACPACCD